MIKVIGRSNCINCNVTKKTLKRNNIEFEYCLLEEIEGIKREELIAKAREKGMMSLPLILNSNNELTNLQEVLNETHRA